MSVGKDTFQKVNDTDHNVQNSINPHSPSSIFFGLRFSLGKQGYRRVWTCFARHRPPEPNQTAKEPNDAEQNVNGTPRLAIIAHGSSDIRPADFSHQPM
jgi:hypothetical protein